MLPPIQLEGRWLGDGVYSAPVPVAEAVRRRMDVILTLDFQERSTSTPRGFGNCFRHHIDNLVRSLVYTQMHQAIEAHHYEIIPICIEFDHCINLRDAHEAPGILAAGERAVAENKDAILAAVGRAPNVEGLGLEAAGVAFGPAGVSVDDRLRTSNPRIFAAGDVASRFKFTHAADALARVAIQNALFLGRARASALTIPWCTYTDPEVARVGINEFQAEHESIPVRTIVQPLAEVDRAVLDGETEGFVKVLVEAGGDKVLGATVVARHAGEMISLVQRSNGAVLAWTEWELPTKLPLRLFLRANFQD